MTLKLKVMININEFFLSLFIIKLIFLIYENIRLIYFKSNLISYLGRQARKGVYEISLWSIIKKSFARYPFFLFIFSFSYLNNLLDFLLLILWLINLLPPCFLFLLNIFLLFLFFTLFFSCAVCVIT